MPGESPEQVPDADDRWHAELERARRHDEQRCHCGHARRQHAISSGSALDRCAATMPGPRACPCSLFRLVRGHQLGNA